METAELEIKDAWVRPADTGMNTAVYFVIKNPGEQDRLLEAETTVAERTEIHLSYLDDAGVMHMEQQQFVLVPQDGELVFEPGGLHVMLINLSRDLTPAEQIQLQLHFEKEGEVTIDVPVENP
ncbi:MAG: copper chaperone PCu(A)C [Anaerolineales bacterium]|jgi:copper(I)-binding protein